MIILRNEFMLNNEEDLKKLEVGIPVLLEFYNSSDRSTKLEKALVVRVGDEDVHCLMYSPSRGSGYLRSWWIR